MGFADIVARARGGSILRSPTPLSPTQDPSSNPTFNEKLPLSDKHPAENDQAPLIQSRIQPQRDPHLVVRTVPTWVHVLEHNDEESIQATTRLLPSSLPSAQVAEHHYDPSERSNRPKPPRGRLHDQEREWAPPLPKGHSTEHMSRWRSYINASAYPTTPGDRGEIFTHEWLARNGPDYSKPWMAGAGEGDMENGRSFRTKRKVWWKRAQRTIIRSPLIPLVIRSIVWVFSLIALAVAASIHRLTYGKDVVQDTASTEMAIIVDAIALIYLFYITYDEYSGKPLGLRSARAKMRLIFLDLFFIVFDSANLSLAFEAGHQEGVCKQELGEYSEIIVDRQPPLCGRQNALASVLLIALIAWLLTFSISVLRTSNPKVAVASFQVVSIAPVASAHVSDK
ncbi:MAG: hypothetical protein LQ346_002529 [Caloplaca aetnensis]|nr:MAG: hypothetical protein LQ346_002529 [Caloplaca aetnensis]